MNRKEEAYNLLHNTLYKGKRRNFGFVKYAGIHTNAHAELEECNKLSPKTRKVTLFLAGIQDPKLQNGKDINTTMPESTLKRKHNSIAYRQNRECVASGESYMPLWVCPSRTLLE